MAKKINSFLLIILLLVGCSLDTKIDYTVLDKVSTFNEFTPEIIDLFSKKILLSGPVEFQFRDTLKVIEWQPYRSDSGGLEFSLPKSWHLEDKNDIFLFANIDGYVENCFSVLKYNKLEYDVTLEEYKDFAIENIKSDTSENYSLLDIRIEDDQPDLTYFLQISSQRENERFSIFSIITEKGDYILDFSLRVNEKDYYEGIELIYFNVLLSFHIEDIPIISPSSKTISVL